MGVAFQRSENTTTTWLTPRAIVDALGPFDLDPATPQQGMPWQTARTMLKPSDDGLKTPWGSGAYVFMNPPFGKGQAQWMSKMAGHGHGIALVMARMEVAWMHDSVLNHPNASAMLVHRGRIKYCTADGATAEAPPAGSLLIAYGPFAKEQLKAAIKSGAVVGKYFDLN
ncbi:DNA N-6-adenine-methyltransferase [Stenotrophomonas rhizophila]|uniref:Adenine methyltransferase n=1 Tax=Stenotrophomonas rhizophila TaxID=216778 RepID=A0A7V7YE54_9GAMM|nr:DNA N-6-adenine-methyltransferase [Stenotrophomonas rhizophila]KAB7628905.1 adenine methyltransferase [Stenotrophomonas rhizophila]